MKLNLIAILIACLSLVGCATNSEIPDGSEKVNNDNFELFAIYGEVHNAMLRQAKTEFNAPSVSPKTKEEALNYVLSIQQEAVSKLDLSYSDKVALSNGLEEYKEYYSTKAVLNTVMPSRSTSEDDEDITTAEIKELIDSAYKEGCIDEFEYDSFVKLIDYVVANAEGSLSNDEFELKVNILISKWKQMYSNVDFSQLNLPRQSVGDVEKVEISSPELDKIPSGSLSGVVLSVSGSSLDYWNNEEASLEDGRALPVFVGANIAGAVIGACSSGLGSYFMSGKVDWRSVGWSAASGAITGSTGVVGKIGRWLSRF